MARASSVLISSRVSGVTIFLVVYNLLSRSNQRFSCKCRILTPPNRVSTRSDLRYWEVFHLSLCGKDLSYQRAVVGVKFRT